MSKLNEHAPVVLATGLLLVAAEAGWVLFCVLRAGYIGDYTAAPGGWVGVVAVLHLVLVIWLFGHHGIGPELINVLSCILIVVWLVSGIGKVLLFPLVPYELPFVGVREVKTDADLILRDEVYAASCPEVSSLEDVGGSRRSGDSYTAIERRFFSWRYAVVMGRSLAGGECTIQEVDLPSNWTEKLSFSFSVIAENFIASLLYAGLPLLFFGVWLMGSDKILREKFVEGLTEDHRRVYVACAFLVLLFLVGVLS